MEQLLASNEGLASRVPVRVTFDDYDHGQLLASFVAAGSRTAPAAARAKGPGPRVIAPAVQLRQRPHHSQHPRGGAASARRCASPTLATWQRRGAADRRGGRCPRCRPPPLGPARRHLSADAVSRRRRARQRDRGCVGRW
jgi:hypothetical protein